MYQPIKLWIEIMTVKIWFATSVKDWFWGWRSNQPEPRPYNGGRLHRCWRSYKASPFFDVDLDVDTNVDLEVVVDVAVDVDVNVDDDVDADANVDVDVDFEDLTSRVNS